MKLKHFLKYLPLNRIGRNEVLVWLRHKAAESTSSESGCDPFGHLFYFEGDREDNIEIVGEQGQEAISDPIIIRADESE
jgi:hypothetical protein